MGIIPEVFDLDEDDYLHVLTDEVTPGQRGAQGTRNRYDNARGRRSPS